MEFLKIVVNYAEFGETLPSNKIVLPCIKLYAQLSIQLAWLFFMTIKLNNFNYQDKGLNNLSIKKNASLDVILNQISFIKRN